MKNLDHALTAANLTRKEAAKAIGTTERNIYRYISGESEATESKIIALARLLHVSTDYLLGLTENGAE